jgi:hypothetical protein
VEAAGSIIRQNLRVLDSTYWYSLMYRINGSFTTQCTRCRRRRAHALSNIQVLTRSVRHRGLSQEKYPVSQPDELYASSPLWAGNDALVIFIGRMPDRPRCSAITVDDETVGTRAPLDSFAVHCWSSSSSTPFPRLCGSRVAAWATVLLRDNNRFT